jgi:hypothetical protein
MKCERQPTIYGSFLKHGVNNHVFEVIYPMPSDVESFVLDEYERFCIMQLRESGACVLNLQDGGRGGKHAEVSKEKIRAANTGIVFTEERLKNMSLGQRNAGAGIGVGKKRRTRGGSKGGIHRSRPVLQYSYSGKLISEYNSAAQASESVTGKSNGRNAISACALGKINSVYGFIWRHKKGESVPQEIDVSNINLRKSRVK